VPKRIQRLSSPRKVDPLERLSEYVSLAKYGANVWNMPSLMMSGSEFGAASPSVSAAASSDDLLKSSRPLNSGLGAPHHPDPCR
jgi:hypothetical protein